MENTFKLLDNDDLWQIKFYKQVLWKHAWGIDEDSCLFK